MAITKTQTPYELLVRWKDGIVAGAHVKFIERIEENGVVLLQTEGEATPVSMAGGAGYPLADILSTAQTTALITAEAATAQAATAAQATTTEQTAHEATKVLLATAVARAEEVDAALAAEQAAHQQTLASKNAEVAALKAPV